MTPIAYGRWCSGQRMWAAYGGERRGSARVQPPAGTGSGEHAVGSAGSACAQPSADSGDVWLSTPIMCAGQTAAVSLSPAGFVPVHSTDAPSDAPAYSTLPHGMTHAARKKKGRSSSPSLFGAGLPCRLVYAAYISPRAIRWRRELLHAAMPPAVSLFFTRRHRQINRFTFACEASPR
ncbi:hypothetical protein HMPREF1207_02119 [Paenibacillus sp. HGH0039]|nr:hypothetical protein HMPREF1207_02119 [Paenibacillus sp. HGH0039]